MTEADAIALITDPSLVAKHAFHPFIEYSERWTKYAAKGKPGKLKSRPIMYASRRDSCIYSHYRGLLSDAYEKELEIRGIAATVLAYRRIPRRGGRGNKNNIHFAADAFSEISRLGDCFVYTLDIKKFFESLGHRELKQLWMRLMSFETMPRDHYQVFRSITRYATVKRDRLYRDLNFIGIKSTGTRQISGYLVRRVPLQVCSGSVFREKVAPLIKTNHENFGIPQGSPISDVLANLYMLEFDTQMAADIGKAGGSYRRYSDDILLIIPGHDEDCDQRLASLDKLLTSLGGRLELQSTKTTICKFSRYPEAVGLNYQRFGENGGKNGLEYLGFRFDGLRIFIRDSTRARLQRKMTYAVNAAVDRLRQSNPGKGRRELKELFDPIPVLRQFHRVRDFESVAATPNEWTFWTYIIRAQRCFGAEGRPIERQVRNFRRSISSKADRLIDKYTKIP